MSTIQDTSPPQSKTTQAAKLKFISGSQALIEGMVAHRKHDAEGTAGFVSGYRGSPLGGFDSMLDGQSARLTEHAITFKPGLNEDLAATACWGTQQLNLMDPTVKGVTAFWYGKGPGVDRAGDVLKHGNMAGTHPLGGVVLFVGDDHGAKSSTVAHQSDQVLAAAGIPVLYPVSVQEYVECVTTAAALSRFASVWVAIKCVTETIEGSALVDLDRPAPSFVLPEVEKPVGGYHIGPGHLPVEAERSLFTYRLPAVKRFAEVNRFDRVTYDAATRTLGIVAPGKSYVDLVEGLRLLGIDADRARVIGLRVFRPLMVWPLVAGPVEAFARGHAEVMVVEEKRPLIEEQLSGYLLRMPADQRPVLSGKLDPEGQPLVSDHGELDPLSVARAVGARLVALGVADAEIEKRWRSLVNVATAKPVAAPARMPAFCSGCPHNRSTRLPEGSMAFGGIGCHGMALFVPELRTPSATHMGGEGANWIGLADYVGTQHIFQNMGEGTYTHSGLLAIRAAVAADATITYKILHNGATAMTGGQPVEGGFSAGQIAGQLLAEGVRKVVIVTERTEPASDIPANVEVRPRIELERVQRTLRELKGVTALIYEQGCAAERRRLRKRGEYPDPDLRMYINPEVCEGCGDCSAKSSCVSLLPLETEQGRKRQIDQESCNKDRTCVEGFCPSFVTVEGAKLRSSDIRQDMVDRLGAALVDPPLPQPSDAFNVVLAGIGGTGVITLGASLARAAQLEGKRVSTFDVTGLAQKNGPVYSHVRILPADSELDYQARIPNTQLDVLIGCDLAATATPAVAKLLDAGRSRAFVNADLVPTASFQRNPDQDLAIAPYADFLAQALPPGQFDLVEPGEIAGRMVGQGALSNVMMLGFAIQRGALPFTPATIEKALGGRKGPDLKNLFAFRVGRLIAQDHALLDEILGEADGPPPIPLADRPTEELIGRAKELLTVYQNAAYADRYEAFVRGVQSRDARGGFAHAVALNLFRLMRYKDEYEVARMYSSPSFLENLNGQFKDYKKLNFHLAPPLISWKKDARGEPTKTKFGPWLLKAFPLLAKLKFLRGTPFDPFGIFADRKLERRLIAEYRDRIEGLLGRLDAVDYDVAIKIADLPARIRGYGPVKERNVEAAEAAYQQLVGKL